MNTQFAIVWLALIPIAATGHGQNIPSAKPVGADVGMSLPPLPSLDSRGIEYLGLVDEQLIEITEIKKKYSQLRGEIRKSNGLNFQEQMAKRSELTRQQDQEIRRVLLPHQKELLEGLRTYLLVQDERLVYSMVDGLIAQQIGLTNSERRAIKQAAKGMYGEYKKELERSQKKAIARLIESFPADKRDRVEELLEPMMRKGGMFATNNDYHFNADIFFGEEADKKALPAEVDE